jgi:hypothetical protein
VGHQLNTEISFKARETLKAEAVKRGLSGRTLLGLILERVILVVGVDTFMEDEGKVYEVAKRAPRGSRTRTRSDIRHVTQSHDPDRRLPSGSVVQMRRRNYDKPMRHAPKTKAEMYEDLRQAVLNTTG